MRKPSPALVIAVLALFVALGGASWAATGGNFILGQGNTASSSSSLSAPVAGGSALTLSNTSTTAGSSALRLNVAAGHPPFTVNSAGKVPSLNTDLLDGRDSSFFLPATGTAADANKLGGFPASTFYRLRTAPRANTFSAGDSGPNVGNYTSITIGRDGLGLISDYDATKGNLKVAHCSNVVCSTATSTALDSTGNVGLFTAITIGRDGLGLISYYDATKGDLKVAHCANVVCSSATKATVDGVNADVGWFTSITLGSDGLGLISYMDASNGDLKVAHCSNLSCSTATSTTIDTGGVQTNVGLYSSITIVGDGLGLISYYDQTNNGLKVAKCSNLACSVATPRNLLCCYGSEVGTHSSITTGADGKGLISFYSAPDGQIEIAKCADVPCTTSYVGVVDSVSSSDTSTSITAGADGFGLVAYRDPANGDLKVGHCSNDFCDQTSSVVVDAVGDTGYEDSVTIGADGLPLIAYHSASTGNLRVAHCGSPLCIRYFRLR
jgi:hypothetical protein